MFKKAAISTLIVLILAALLAPAAFAQETAPPDRPALPKHAGRGIGQVTAIAADSFTVETPRRGSATLLVTERTVFRTRAGEASFADLEVGDWVSGLYTRTPDGLVALRVLILPEDFDPAEFRRHVLRGEVWSVDLPGSSFTLHTLAGEEITLLVDEETSFRSRGDLVTGLADLQPHMRVTVYANRDESGTATARLVVVSLRPSRHAGEIQAVDPVAGVFKLLRRDGQLLVFSVDENTRFHSQDGSVTGIEDLQAGMQALVGAVALPDGKLLARSVGVRIP